MKPRQTRPPRQRARVTTTGLIREAIQGLMAVPVRTTLTVVGISVGLAAMVASVGISQSTGANIAFRFFEIQAEHLMVHTRTGTTLEIREEALHNLSAYPGVQSVALTSEYREGLIVTARGTPNSINAIRIPATVIAARHSLFRTINATFPTGRPFDIGHVKHGARVVVLGEYLADRLGIWTIEGQPTIFIGDQEFSVIGIVGSVNFYDAVTDSVVIPATLAGSLNATRTADVVAISTEPASTHLIAGITPLILAPATPGELTVSVPSRPPDVAAAIESDIDSLAIALTSVGILVAAISVTAVMTITVTERTPEIGLRRALGASKTHIATQFLLESATVGLLGGLLGATIGVSLITGIAELRNMEPVLSPEIPFLAIGLGAVVGTLAGLGPALRASRMAPVSSLRS